MDTSRLKQAAVYWHQSYCRSTILQGSINKMLKKRKEKRCLLDYLQPPDMGCCPIPGGWASLGPYCWTGVGSTQPGTVPFPVNTFKRPIVCCVLAGTRVLNGTKGSRTLGATDTQPPRLPGAEVPNSSLLPDSTSWNLSTLSGVLWPRMGQWNGGLWSFRGRKYWTASPECLVRQ